MMKESKPTLLLHCCCAPCSTHPFRLIQPDFQVTVFFYNPNIHPQNEYTAREKEIRQLSEKWGFPLIVDSYESDDWFALIQGFEDEPEGGARCEICFRMRPEKTAQLAHDNQFDCFATTLSVSPHKNVTVINQIGRDLQEVYPVRFYEADFKKKDGFQKSCLISREEKLYRQDYCGCVFSRLEAEKRKHGK